MLYHRDRADWGSIDQQTKRSVEILYRCNDRQRGDALMMSGCGRIHQRNELSESGLDVRPPSKSYRKDGSGANRPLKMHFLPDAWSSLSVFARRVEPHVKHTCLLSVFQLRSLFKI
ncbi:hypothetical protein EVAR_33307_1 [Eumeta japonica]|uniref:Uncharacterized protein n=1 Tax=Eumeta variegata TaxID=151549 RepID=A0A4C1WEZ9_EUMVA|nr:hypothetical protein EVAR_33307_1 [Eumeta japonica]